MATERIATFVKIYKVDSKTGFALFVVITTPSQGLRITEAQEKYDFLPFIYSGATVSRTGDNVTSELTLSSNDIAGSNAELVEQNYRADVRVCRMSDDFLHCRRVLSLRPGGCFIGGV